MEVETGNMYNNCFRRFFILILIGVVVITLLSFTAVASLDTPGGVVLITWDGTQKETVQKLLEDGKLEHLSLIQEEGSWINISITRHYPDSMASRAEILTGYSPMITGVHRTMAYGEIPKNLTIFERLKDNMGSEAVSTAVVTSKKGSIGTAKGLPFVNARDSIDYFWDRDADALLAGSIAVETLYSIDAKKPFFLYIQLKDASQAGSAFTISSKQYLDHRFRTPKRENAKIFTNLILRA